LDNEIDIDQFIFALHNPLYISENFNTHPKSIYFHTQTRPWGECTTIYNGLITFDPCNQRLLYIFTRLNIQYIFDDFGNQTQYLESLEVIYVYMCFIRNHIEMHTFVIKFYFKLSSFKNHTKPTKNETVNPPQIYIHTGLSFLSLSFTDILPLMSQRHFLEVHMAKKTCFQNELPFQKLISILKLSILCQMTVYISCSRVILTMLNKVSLSLISTRISHTDIIRRVLYNPLNFNYIFILHTQNVKRIKPSYALYIKYMYTWGMIGPQTISSCLS